VLPAVVGEGYVPKELTGAQLMRTARACAAPWWL